MARQSGSYALYGKLSGCLIVFAVVVGAAFLSVLCLVATHLTIAFGRMAEPGLGRGTNVELPQIGIWVPSNTYSPAELGVVA